jgi:glycosyltransferase involved in cell wall biosynthesis
VYLLFVESVTVSIPARRAEKTIRRAVQAVLRQNHSDVKVIVINDGDTNPWQPLEDIADPRLIRFDLPDNRGRYFADAVTLAACTTEFWMPHDADDAALPQWITRLMHLMKETPGAEAAFCGVEIFHPQGMGAPPPPSDPAPHTPEKPCAFTHNFHMAGLWRTSFIRSLGGPHPAFRVGYDTMLTGAANATGKCAVTDEQLYHRWAQYDSLTRSPQTTFGSRIRNEARDWIIEQSSTVNRLGLQGAEAVGRHLSATMPDHLVREVRYHAARLKEHL